MKEFTIRPNGFREIQRKMLLSAIPLLLLAAGVGVAVSILNTKKEEATVTVLSFVIPLMAAAAGAGLYRGVNRQRRLFESYTLTLTSSAVMREQMNTPPVCIYVNDIKTIVKAKDGGFVIRGKEPTDIIIIPSQIDKYGELEAALQALCPLSTKSSLSSIQKFRGLLPLLAMGLMLTVYTATNKVVVVITGTLLVVLMTWSFVEVRRSRNVDSRTKGSVWWVLLVLASVITVMITKLYGSAS